MGILDAGGIAMNQTIRRRAKAIGWCIGLVVWTGSTLRAQVIVNGVFTMQADGSDVRKVVKVDGYYDHSVPRWSHDGKRLTFYAKPIQGNGWRTFVVNVDGTELREAGANVAPDWSPDDKQLAFRENLVGKGLPNIYVQNLDGQGLDTIAAGHSPRWSPDGAKLAFSDLRTLHVLDLVSGDDRSLFETNFEEVSHGFDWSPNGKQLAVVVRQHPGAKKQLLFVSAQGAAAGLRNRLQGEMGGTVSWSPDGKQLVYSENNKIRILDVEGQGAGRLVRNQKGKCRHPSFSPDGKRIAFVSDRL
jgi:Tol biopolymer transport system component